jgi:hypothetical protein
MRDGHEFIAPYPTHRFWLHGDDGTGMGQIDQPDSGRLVIPVLGPELLVVPENGELTRLYDMWGSALAAQTHIDRPEDARRWTIYDVANLLSQRERRRSGIRHR